MTKNQELPRGFRCAAVASGIKKKDRLDLGLIVADAPASCAGVFTRNRVTAAPVQLTRPRIAAGRCQAVLVNSGNANACTGAAGLEVAERSGGLCASALGVGDELVAVASTGVIGQLLPLAPIETALPGLVTVLGPQVDDFAAAIMTTDQFPKISVAAGEAGGVPYRILGVAKGAGMIHPDMATMLGFVMTDAALTSAQLQRLLPPAVDASFNAITVDGDTSTNDMVLLLASGAAGCPIEARSANEAAFAARLQEVLLDLAKMIVRDGEGATKLVEIRVEGAKDVAQARTAAASVATSSLVKTAFFGEDANWGRIIAAIGYAGIEIDPDRIDVHFDEVCVAKGGIYVGPEVEEAATAVLKKPEFRVIVDLHLGDGAASYYTSDLTYDYVKINADYRT